MAIRPTAPRCALGTPLPPLPPGEGIGGGPKERWSLAFSHRATPPPANWNWHEGSNSSRNMHILTIWRRQLAEGVSGPNGYLRSRQGSTGGSEGGLAKRIENCASKMEEFAKFAKFCEAL